MVEAGSSSTIWWVSDPHWLSDDEMRLFRAFLSASSGVTSRLDALLKSSAGLTLDDYEVLVHLSAAHGHRVRMSELSKLLLHSKSRLTQRVDRLVTRGLVRREKCADDARGTWAVLTDDGMTALEAAAPDHVGHVREQLFNHLEADEIQIVMTALERIAAGVQLPN